MPSAQPPRERGGPWTENTGAVDITSLANDFGRVARLLEAEDDTEAMLDQLVGTAVEIIPGAEEASISVVLARTHVQSQHPTSDLPAKVDAIQSELGEGPCLSSAYEEHTVRVPDVRHEERWPRFAERAAAAGAGSMLSFQLYVEGDNLGALNLYSRTPNAFDDESEQVGLLFASHAAVAIADARKVDDLSRAIDTRDVIGQAKGILMERYSITGDQAFRVLTRISQNSHRKLRDVAGELATTGKLDELAP
jgi:GAF domain-containing protein